DTLTPDRRKCMPGCLCHRGKLLKRSNLIQPPQATKSRNMDNLERLQKYCCKQGAEMSFAGVSSMAKVYALADDASWIWKAVQRVLTVCVQRLDIFQACAHLHQCAEWIHGEETEETDAAYKNSRGLLIRLGWVGVCQLTSECSRLTTKKNGSSDEKQPTV